MIMTKYYIIEGKLNGEFNATSKARLDVEKILENNKIEKLYVNTKNGIKEKKIMKWKQFLNYKRNLKIWDKSLKKVKRNDIIFIQYPLLNTTVGLVKLLKKYKKKGIVFVSIIHDLDSLRYKPEDQGKFLYNRVCFDDKYVLKEMNYIIAHNSSMKKELIKLGNNSDKIFELGLFDYLVNKDLKNLKRNCKEPIIIAGNLSLSKSKYLSYLNYLDLKFNLYGVGFDETISAKNVNYCGSFKPEELVEKMQGGYGLVWDGISIDTCTGGFGEYLKYNNPHKASLYLTSGIPIIVWSKSAIADFVIKNNVGIAIDNLNNLKEKLDKITDEDYKKMINNAKKISDKLRKGYYTTEIINKIIDITSK